ncbi:TetR/AcrR family transcriptional regulator [Dactylosporangium cerinum]
MGRPKQFDPDVAVNKAMELFWRKGFAETTPQDLVAELGIGKGSLYSTFFSKRALFDLALQRYVEMRVAGVVETLERPGPVTERLRVALLRLADTDVTPTPVVVLRSTRPWSWPDVTRSRPRWSGDCSIASRLRSRP